MQLTRLDFRADTTPDPLAPDPAGGAGAGTLSGMVVPFGVVVQRFGIGVQFGPGSCQLPTDLATVKLLIQHDDERPVGYAIEAHEDAAGLHMSFQLADHPRAAELAREAEQLLRDGFSVGIEPDTDTMRAITARLYGDDTADAPITMTGTLREVSACSIPQFNDARASSAHRHTSSTSSTSAAAPVATFTRREDTMTTTTELPAATAAVVPGAPPVAPAQLPTIEELTAAVEERIGHAAPAHPLAAFSGWAGYADAVWADPRARFALADQITTDNPGVVPPAWLTEVFGIVDLGSPLTAALGAGALPPEGMELNFPYYDGDYRTLVQQQVTEKTPIHSAKVSLKRGTADIETFAGGSDISYQLLRRSSPSYRDAYNRILNMAFAWALDAFYGPLVIDAAGQSVEWDAANTDTDAAIESFRGALFAASAKVRSATGRPADVVLASTDRFGFLGAHGLPNPQYGTQNVAGTASAATLTVNVNGLLITEVPSFPDGTVLVTNNDAARIHRDGPFPVSAEDVEKLGQNVAVWGMASLLTPAPNGIVSLDAAAGGGAPATAAKTSK